MKTLPYRNHVFTLTPTPADSAAPGLDLSCGPHWLMRIKIDFSPTSPIHHWLDRAIELIDLLNIQQAC